MSREDLVSRIEKIRAQHQRKSFSGYNEARTRLEVIDEILISLGWPKSSFHPETTASKVSYLDYLLHMNRSPVAVVEAKRVGETFHTPKKLGAVHYQFSYLRTAFGAPFAAVTEQAQRYAREVGVPVAIVTNGLDWIAFHVATQLTGRNDQKAICFGNLCDEHFPVELFFQLMSPEGFESHALLQELVSQNRQQTDFSRTLAATGFRWNRSVDLSSNQVDEVYHTFFSDITDVARREMMKTCFVDSSTLDQFQKDIERLLRDVSPEFIEAENIQPADFPRIGQIGDMSGVVVILTGSVGAGKSTFVSKLHYETLRNISSRCVVVDLINAGIYEGDGLVNQFWSVLRTTWCDRYSEDARHTCLKQAFHKDLESFRNGAKQKLWDSDAASFTRAEAELLESLSQNDEKFLTNVLRLHQNQKTNCVIVLDNVDRNSEAFQEKAYLFAHHLASKSGAKVIVTLRESTYFRGKTGGFLDVRSDDRIFHLSSPDLQKVLGRRIRYIEDFIQNDHRKSHWPSNFVPLAKEIAEVLKKSLMGNTSQLIWEILASASWHNVRKFFELLRQIYRFSDWSEGSWNEDDVIFALSVGSQSSLPVFGNIFPESGDAGPTYYLGLRALAFLQCGVPSHQLRAGISLSELSRVLISFGYTYSESRRITERLVRIRAIECIDIPADEDFTLVYEIENSHSFRLSPLGYVLLKTVCLHPAYLLAKIGEISIHNSSYYHELSKDLEDFPALFSQTDRPRELVDLFREQGHGTVLKLLGECLSKEASSSWISSLGKVEHVLQQWVEEPIKNHEASSFPTQETERSAQLQLSLDETTSPAAAPKDLPIPRGIHVEDKSSKYTRYIFWALANGRSRGLKSMKGSTLTKEINRVLVDHPIFSNNVSRALRNLLAQECKWLRRRPEGSYELSPDWESHWVEVFGD